MTKFDIVVATGYFLIADSATDEIRRFDDR